MLFPTLLILSLSGCVTMPAPQGQTYSAGYVGDRNSLSLSEQVFTVRVIDGASELRNLHVNIEVFINPKNVSLSSEYEFTGIIRRLEPRVKAHLGDFVPVGKQVTIQSLVELKNEIAREARNTFAASYSKWKHSADFDLQVVVTDFYLSDLSLGSPATAKRTFW